MLEHKCYAQHQQRRRNQKSLAKEGCGTQAGPPTTAQKVAMLRYPAFSAIQENILCQHNLLKTIAC